MESAVVLHVPLETINALANTVTAGAILWAARTLRRALADLREESARAESRRSSS